jgi:UDP-N-acetylglucosamine--N-acetylmuramyl-(pentapeptide) pyrophosphoryl-undecaprenol N-acetylglucosamine transferase
MRIIISGGGTGGHIFPAIAIGKALKRLQPDADILFVGAKGKMEMEKVPAEGFPIRGLWISGFRRSLSLSNLLFPLRLLVSMGQSLALLMKYKPDAVIGVGGFASGPVMRAASWLGIPIYIQEQNSFPGVTNRLMARKSRLIFTAYPAMEQWFPPEKTILAGNPVRRNVIAVEGLRDEALQFFGLQNDRVTILVIGGSQGARSINQAVKGCLENDFFANMQWIWQTGLGFADEARGFVESRGLANVKVHPFIQRMDLAYAAADLIISRAGAISISELCNIGKPVVLIPFPFAAADHQMHNARRIAEAGGAIVIEDAVAGAGLCATLPGLVADETKRRQMGEAIRRLAIPDADERIAEAILNDLANLKKVKS